MSDSLTWKIGGEAGFGIMAAGAIFSKALSRAGLFISTTNEYPSRVRGGHNTYLISASEEEISSPNYSVNLLVALNQETIDLHQDELTKQAGIIFDKGEKGTEVKIQKGPKLYPVPLMALATEGGGPKIMMNNVALGASWAVINLPFSILASVIVDIFAKKGEKVVNENTQAAQKGFDYIRKNFSNDFQYKLKKGKAPERLVISGNEAIALGAIAAGLDFAAIYPMTPINGLLHYLAGHETGGGYLFKQPEDEIAGINMAIGASFAGGRSLVATSGGGFDLMVEGLSLSAMTETPLVIVMGTRPGPSTGLATWTSQADLKFLLSASQGDFMRVVLAPGDPEECFKLTFQAFNLADRFQTPVFLLVDKFLTESLGTIAISKIKYQTANINRGKLYQGGGKYQRYQITADGISPRAYPGQTYFLTNSYEHDEFGFSTEDARVICAMVEKRARKFALLEKEAPDPEVFGDKNAEIILLGWGSTKGPAIEAVNKLNKSSKTKIKYLHLNWINPLPKKAVSQILSQAKRVIDVEGNFSGQMAGWLREQVGIEIKDKILRYDGRPFFAEDIISEVKKILGK
jgi:2-oxoglutarate ferredoxin oxidoreductase subunit alpha